MGRVGALRVGKVGGRLRDPECMCSFLEGKLTTKLRMQSGTGQVCHSREHRETEMTEQKRGREPPVGKVVPSLSTDALPVGAREVRLGAGVGTGRGKVKCYLLVSF